MRPVGALNGSLGLPQSRRVTLNQLLINTNVSYFRPYRVIDRRWSALRPLHFPAAVDNLRRRKRLSRTEAIALERMPLARPVCARKSKSASTLMGN